MTSNSKWDFTYEKTTRIHTHTDCDISVLDPLKFSTSHLKTYTNYNIKCAHYYFSKPHKQFGVNKNEMISIWICVYTVWFIHKTTVNVATLLLSSVFSICACHLQLYFRSLCPNNAERSHIQTVLACSASLCVLFQNLIQILFPFFTF